MKKDLQNRYHLIDALRGFWLLNMIVYHTLYDLVFLFGAEIPFFLSDAARVWQQIICTSFIFIAGFCHEFSRNQKKKILILLICAVLVYVGSVIVNPSQAIVFGMLTFMAEAALITALLRKPLNTIPAAAGFAVCFCIYLIIKNIPFGFIGPILGPHFELPHALYTHPLLIPFGLPDFRYSSADYVPLFSSLLLYLSGFYAKKLAVSRPRTVSVLRFHIPILCEIGRNTLIVYLLHQPLIYGLLMLIL